MKRALVLSLAVVLGLGFASFAQTFSGTWSTDAMIVIDNTGVTPTYGISVPWLVSILDTEYAISGWTFGFNTFINTVGLFDLNFDFGGSLGAFTYNTFLDFNTTTPGFEDWENVVQVSLAGVDVYGAFALQYFIGANGAPLGTNGGALYGFGWAVGGHGVAGLVEVWAQANFNISGGITHYMSSAGFKGWDYMTDWGTYYDCYDDAWYSGDWGVQTNSCTAGWSSFYVYLKAPLACMDLIVNTSFSCTTGWNSITFGLNDINLGAGWFQLDDLDIKFTPTSKTVTWDFTLTFGSAVCVTPYFDIVMYPRDTDVAGATHVDSNIIDGVVLHALTLKYEYNGVTFKAGELFDNWYYAGFNKQGGLVLDFDIAYAGYSSNGTCLVPNANEFVGIWYSSDSCCGGSLDASFVTFFEGGLFGTDSTNLFDVVLMVANVEVGIGSNFSIRTGMDIDTALHALYLGFTLSW